MPLPLTASTLLLQARRLEIDAIRHLAGRIDLVDVIGQLTHLLQRERGASSLYLASQGRRFVELRQHALAEALPMQDRLSERFCAELRPVQAATPRMLGLMAWIQLGLDALPDLRERIDAQTLTAHEAVAAFSRLIAGLMELIHHIADAAQLPGISRLLVAMLHLVQGKEAAGQERALGALLFGSGVCTESEKQRILHLIQAQERNLKVFVEFAEPALGEQWERWQIGPEMAGLERMRRILCSTPAGGRLDVELSDPWFDLSSQRITALLTLQTELVSRLRQGCEAQIQQAQQDLLDSEGLLQRMKDNPPAHPHAVERFFDRDTTPHSVPELMPSQTEASASLLTLVQTQSDRLAQMESELEAARRALQERKLIERAKGLLMSRLSMSEEAAFRALQKTAMDQNRRLVDVAEATLSLPAFIGRPSD